MIQVIIEDVDDSRKRYTFPCGQWLATDEGDGELFKVLYPVGGSRSKDGDPRRRGRGRGDDDDNGKRRTF